MNIDSWTNALLTLLTSRFQTSRSQLDMEPLMCLLMPAD